MTARVAIFKIINIIEFIHEKLKIKCDKIPEIV